MLSGTDYGVDPACEAPNPPGSRPTPHSFLLQACRCSRKCLGVSIGSCSPWSAAARVPQPPPSIHPSYPIPSHPIYSIKPAAHQPGCWRFSPPTSNQQSIPILTTYQPVFLLLLHWAALILIELDCLALPPATDITSVARSFLPPPILGSHSPPTNQTDSSVKPIAFLADLLFRHHRFRQHLLCATPLSIDLSIQAV